MTQNDTPSKAICTVTDERVVVIFIGMGFEQMRADIGYVIVGGSANVCPRRIA